MRGDLCPHCGCASQSHSTPISFMCWDLVCVFKAVPFFKKHLKIEEYHLLSKPQPVVLWVSLRLQWDSSRTGSEPSRNGKTHSLSRLCVLLLACYASLFQGHVNLHLHCWLFRQMATVLALFSMSAQMYSLSWRLFLPFRLEWISLLPVLYITILAYNLWPGLFSVMTIQFLNPEMGASFIIKWTIR